MAADGDTRFFVCVKVTLWIVPPPPMFDSFFFFFFFFFFPVGSEKGDWKWRGGGGVKVFKISAGD